MGTDKALIPLGGKPLISHVLNRIRGLADEEIVTTNNPKGLRFTGKRLIADRDPGAGALQGLHTALSAASGDIVLIVACDMPFLNRALLKYLLDLSAACDVIVPHWNGRHQPLHAVYRREACLPAVGKALTRGDRRMISFYDEVAVTVVSEDDVATIDPVGRSFFNINTPDDLLTAQRMMADSQSS